MKRRHFVGAVGAGSVAAMAGCAPQETRCEGTVENTSAETIKWNMVTTWPKNFQGLGEGAEHIAQLINQMSGGRLQVKVFGAGEIVPFQGVFDAVGSGVAQMGHGAAYYWRGKMPSAPFFSTIPYGLNANELTSWILRGGGYELWRELYEPFGIVPFLGGNTGVQMAGWFNKEINSLDDLKGLRMRIPGLGGEVLKRAGGIPILKGGGEVFTALETGNIDAAEFAGPYNDLAMGLYKAAKYYYYPGWHEPGPALETIVNKEAYNALPDDLKAIVENACNAANQDIYSNYIAKNNSSLKVLVEDHNVELRRLPDDVLAELRVLADEVVAESVADDPLGQRILASFMDFREQVRDWHAISEYAYTDIINK
jgi:TRAP-type mannitol/chloroaromatic compound transport system substrate-binding protein